MAIVVMEKSKNKELSATDSVLCQLDGEYQFLAKIT